jgi:glyoxylase-like metal-dependent hydrolase (beta-lactamase superfamily II)
MIRGTRGKGDRPAEAANTNPGEEWEEVEFKRLEVGILKSNCYILNDSPTQESLIIDPGWEPARILSEVKGRATKHILLTHGHRDLLGAMEEVRRYTGAPVGIHAADAKALKKQPDFFLQDGQRLAGGDSTVNVLHTPGHSPGGVCFQMVGSQP